MDLSRLTLDFGTAMTNNVKEAEATVEDNIGKIVGELLSRLQTETGGDPFELRDRTSAMLEGIRTGNGIGINTAAPAPATAPALGTGSGTDASDAERLGNELLRLTGGDVANAEASLDIHRQVANKPETSALVGQVLQYVTGDEVARVGDDRLGAFIVGIIKTLATHSDTIVETASGLELQSHVEVRDANTANLKAFRELVYAAHGATVPSAPTDDMLKGAKDEIANIRALGSQQTTTALNNVGTALGVNRGTADDTAYEVMLTTGIKEVIKALNEIGTELSVSRAGTDTHVTYAGRLATAAKTLKGDLNTLEGMINNIAYNSQVNYEDSDSAQMKLRKSIEQKGGRGSKLSL